jgi:hypothetical protein
MKYMATLDATDPQDVRSSAGIAWETDAHASWEVDELTEVRETLGSRWSNRWLGAIVAIAVGIVGFGFIGQGSAGKPSSPEVAGVEIVDPDRLPLSEAPFPLTAPVEGAVVRGGLVEVRGIASRSLGSIHLAVVMGDAVLGWTNVDSRGAGPVVAVIPVFAPRFDAPAELRIDVVSSRVGDGSRFAVPLRIHSPDEVGLWRIVTGGPTDAPTVIAEGFAALAIQQVEVRVRTNDGQDLGSSFARVGYEEGRPGAFGGRLVGLGSFTGRVALVAPPTAEPLVVAVTWRDPLMGVTRGLERTIEIRPNLAPGRSVEHHGGLLEDP